MIEHIKRIVGEYLSQFVRPKYGTVTSYDPGTYRVKVLLQPEEIETGWIQVAAPMVGNNFGVVFGPSPGDLVRIDFLDGSAQAAVMGNRFFHDGVTPPHVEPGEIQMVGSAGLRIHMEQSGKMTLSAPSGAGEIDIIAANKIVIDAPDVSIQGINFITHEHADPQGGVTGTPQGQA